VSRWLDSRDCTAREQQHAEHPAGQQWLSTESVHICSDHDAFS